jgi:predicted transcriptional regulator
VNTVVLEVNSLKETLAEAVPTMKTGRAEPEARISSATRELLREILTSNRSELSKTLFGAGPLSIREAARRVGRDVKAVHGDITALLGAPVEPRRWVARTEPGRIPPTWRGGI